MYNRYKEIKYFDMILIILVIMIPSLLNAQDLQTKDMCLNCHITLDGKFKQPAALYQNDIHYRNGIKCSSCHGGDPTSDDMDKAMNKSKGYIGVPSGFQVSKICSKCHSNEFNTLMKSVHGQSSTGKGVIINNCITCHGIHNIVPVKSPASKVNGANMVNTCSKCHSSATFMKNYNPGISVDQLEKYKTSVHGQKIFKGDSKAANCASCHGNHDIKKVKDPNSNVYVTNIPSTCNKCHGDADYMKEYNIPTDQYEKYKKSVHGTALLEKGDLNAPSCNKCHGDHGAAPPEIESIAQVCGTCHVLNSQMFQESPHKNAFAEKNLHECSACHSNHNIEKSSDDFLGDKFSSFCIKCHKDGDKGLELAIIMKQLIDSLNNEVSVANYFINEAEQKGMDITDAKFDYNDIKKILITTRHVMHYINLEKYTETINEGFKITSKAKVTGEEAVKDYYIRRLGLGISTIFITLIGLGIYLKLRKTEKKQRVDQNR